MEKIKAKKKGPPSVARKRHTAVLDARFPKHVDEFVFRYNTRNSGEHQRFNLFLQNTEHRLTYNKLIHG